MVEHISQQIWQTFTAMFLGIVLPGTYMVTEHFLGTQIVTRHLYSRYLCYWTFIFQVAMLLDIYIPGSYVTGHLYSR